METPQLFPQEESETNPEAITTLEVNAQQFGIEETKANQIKEQFKPMLDKMAELEVQYNKILQMPIDDPRTAEAAKKLRNQYVKTRTGTAEIHKTQKAFYLAAGRYIDSWKNVQLFAAQGIEEKLEKIEKYAENQLKLKLESLRIEREQKLKEVDGFVPANVAEMSEIVWENYLLGATLMHKKKQEEKEKEQEAEKKEEEEKAETDRIAREEAERKQKEAEAQAEKERLAREEAEKKQKEEQAKADKERLAREEEEKKRKQAEAKAEADRKAREEAEKKQQEEKAKAEKERLARDEAEKKRKEAEAQAEKDRIAREQAVKKQKEQAEKLAQEKKKREEAEAVIKQQEDEKKRQEKERKAALKAPDKEKLQQLAKTFLEVQMPEMKSDEGKEILRNVEILQVKLTAFITEKANTLS